MSSIVSYSTVTSCGLGALRLNVKSAVTVPALPSVTLTLSIEIAGPVVVRDRPHGLPVTDRRVHDAFARSTEKVSLTSSIVSPLTMTIADCEV